MLFFFFKQKTAYEMRISDWSSDVCSSDLPLALQRVRDVARDDALGKTLDDRRLADARLTDEHRVVLGTTRQHLHHPTDLGVAPDHRVELAEIGRASCRERVCQYV